MDGGAKALGLNIFPCLLLIPYTSSPDLFFPPNQKLKSKSISSWTLSFVEFSERAGKQMQGPLDSPPDLVRRYLRGAQITWNLPALAQQSEVLDQNPQKNQR